MTKPARVGRGLASLIPESALDTPVGAPAVGERDGLRMVPIDELRANPEQPRKAFAKGELEELAGSIKVHGVLSPLIVRRHDGRYVIIAGERRMKAAALAGLSEVPVVIREVDEANLQLELALVENLQRADLNPVEAATGFDRLINKHGYTQEQVASAVGKNRSTIANAVRLLNLPEFALDSLRNGDISAGHARALLPMADDHERLATVIDKIRTHALNVRQVERLVSENGGPTNVTGAPDRKRKEHEMEYAEKLLRESLHTSVSITPKKKGGGRISIDYADAEDLERLIGRLRGEAA